MALVLLEGYNMQRVPLVSTNIVSFKILPHHRQVRILTIKPLADVNDQSEPASKKDPAGRRQTVANLERQRFKKKQVDNLETNFRRNFRSIAMSKFNYNCLRKDAAFKNMM
jgi:hypothetical protein